MDLLEIRKNYFFKISDIINHSNRLETNLSDLKPKQVKGRK